MPAACLGVIISVGPLLATVALATDEEIVVREGDTLTGISRRHDVTIAALVGLNGIRDSNRIFAGQRLTVSRAPGASQPAARAAARVHVVKRGDNLWSIARYFGVSLSELQRVNDIRDASRIRVGQRLTIPGGAGTAAPRPPASSPAPRPAPDARVHVVKRGDNLWSIARYYGVSLAALQSANGIRDASRLRVGQRLTLPGRAQPAPAPKPAPGPAPAPPTAGMPDWMAKLVAQRSAMRQLITTEAKRAGVPVPFALAVAWQESGWRQDVVSSAGAIGVMQLMPSTARWIGESMLKRPVNPHDARDNVKAGVRLLAYYLDRYDGDRALVLAAYYQGQGAVDRHGIYPVSRPYIASVKALVKLFGG